MLPPLLSAFHQLFPQIRLHLVEGTVSGNIADALYDGTADLCIGYQPENTEELAVTPLFEEKFVVLVPDRLMKEHHLDRKLGEGALSMDRFGGAALCGAASGDHERPGLSDPVPERRDRAGSGGLHPESDHGGIPVHGGDGGLCAASDLPVTRPAALRPREYPPVQPGGLDRLSIFLLDTSGIGRFQISVCRLKSKLLTRAGREFISLAREIYSGVSAGQIPPQFHFESSR